MKAQRRILLLGVIFLNVTWVAIAHSQAGPGSGRCMAKYDPKTEITIQAPIEEVQQVTGKQGWNGTHLKLMTQTGTLEVQVGPSAYVASQQFSFVKGDKIEVTGSKTTLQGTEVLLAREIRRGGKTLVLRDANGLPKWAGGRRGRP